MGARLRSWWQQIKQHRVAIMVATVVLVVAIALIIIEVWFYGTGFNGYNQVTTAHTISGLSAGTVTRTEVYQPGKTLWDWLQLLIIPAVLAVGGYLFSFTTSRNERKAADLHNQTERAIAQDNQREAALKEYFEKMSELLLHENLRQSDPDDEVRKIARVWTLTVLQRLDGYRKGSLLQFVHESGLIEEGKSIIDLSGADLTNASLVALVLTNANLSRTYLMSANLMVAHLAGANLSGTTLIGANLTSADLTGVNLVDASISLRNLAGKEPINTILYETNLTNANLSGARLNGSDLRYTNLTGADLTGTEFAGALVTEEQLKKAKSLKGATMPDGSIHP
jgi:uncharacterized protein YjbI with pentapeptide repeats